MNLLEDPIFPVITRAGEVKNVSFSDLADANIIDFHFPRDDLQGAGYQFAIAVLQTGLIFKGTMSLKDKSFAYPGITRLQEWEAAFQDPPLERIGCMVENLKHAFYVDGSERLFMQDAAPLKSESEVAALLIDSPGVNTKKQNKDFFVKRGRIHNLCLSMAAFSLFTLQINAPAGGQGHLTGVRGGGPLTTLVFPHKEHSSLWEKVWMNVLLEEWVVERKPGSFHSPGLFPWLGPIRASDKKQVVTQNEDGIDVCHVYWATPRRIRLIIEENTDSYPCAISEKVEAKIVSKFKYQVNGHEYSGDWLHPLTPYSQEVKKNKSGDSANSIKGPLLLKKGQDLSYLNWMEINFSRAEKGMYPARVVESFHRAGPILDSEEGSDFAFLHCFGYDMDKMQVKCWYRKRFPFIEIDEGKKELFLETVEEMVGFVRNCLKACRLSLGPLLVPKSGKQSGKPPDITFINREILSQSEEIFFSTIDRIKEEGSDSHLKDIELWSYNVIKVCMTVFDSLTIKPVRELIRHSEFGAVLKARAFLKNKLYKIRGELLEALGMEMGSYTNG